MCGIGGILRTDGQPIPEEWLDAIDARIAYRGPDGEGRFRDRVEVDTPQGKKTIEVAFVHRRLSIIDHADGGQPMVSERGRTDDEGLVAVVFNGCIYNHRELRKELEAAGHRFVTDHSDTEVLIHGWREWDHDIIAHLEGMYAFALWDRISATLVIARDWCGRKPLYVLTGRDMADIMNTAFPDCVAFSSDMHCLRRLARELPNAGPRDRESTEDALLRYIAFGYLPDNDDIDDLTDVMRPAPIGNLHGTNAVERASFYRSLVIYESPTYSIPGWIRPKDWRRDQRRDTEVLLDQAVRRRLEADVPLGCFLSGGVDSSLITHFAKRHKPDLRTFSVKMPDPRYDESHHAEQVAAHIGTDHTTLDCDPKPAEDLVYLIGILGQPFADSSILPTYWVSKAAREHVKVAIAGDGGDELFLGYERYLAARLLMRHWWWLRCLPLGMLHRRHPKTRAHKLARLVDMARDFRAYRLMALESLFTSRQLARLLPESRDTILSGWMLPEDRSQPWPMRLLYPDMPRHDLPIAALRNLDLHGYLPNDLMRKVDTASMACALEVRCPFLDRDLAAAVLAMPIDDLIPGGKRKGLLRTIARKYLPKEVVDRPKMGFAIPIGEWFRSDYGSMKTLLLDHLESAEPFGPISLNRRAVQRFIDEHMSGKRDHGQRLFALLTLSIWARSL